MIDFRVVEYEMMSPALRRCDIVECSEYHPGRLHKPIYYALEHLFCVPYISWALGPRVKMVNALGVPLECVLIMGHAGVLCIE